MRQHYELAELIVASWKLANKDERMPTSHGLLDRALKDLLPELPGWVQKHLSFADTRVGLRCLELPDILDCAQESFLTSEPNYTYLTTEIKVDELVCERMLRDLKIDLCDAKRWGNQLKKAIDQIAHDDDARPLMIEAA